MLGNLCTSDTSHKRGDIQEISDNILSNIFQFLNKSFLSYGYMTMADLTLEPTNRVDPMVRTLPIVTMCDLAKFGTGGRQEIIQVRLLFNYITEK